MEMVGDVLSGRNVKQSLKERGLTGIKRTISDIVRQSPSVDDRVNISTAPKRVSQRASKKNKKNKKEVVVKPRSKDIFN